jgi:hypothetical protein
MKEGTKASPDRKRRKRPAMKAESKPLVMVETPYTIKNKTKKT